MTEEKINKIYDILVKYGAIEDNRLSFVQDMNVVGTSGIEWRFCGVFGYGGKFHKYSDGSMCVTMYSEDVTLERETCREMINKEIQELQESMFIAYLTQAGEGCDYTIDCGKKMIRLNADNRKDAIEELRLRIVGGVDAEGNDFDDDGYGYNDERMLEEAEIFEVKEEIKVPLEKWYADAEKVEIAEKLDEEEKKERAEFERLKKKFN